MSDSSIIREFLVGLGFKVDKKSFETFQSGLKGSTTAAVALGDIIAKVAEAVARAVLKMAENLDTLYFTSRRVNAAAENIKAFGFALTQLGGTAQGAQSALEGIASFMRSNPGGERYIQALGVQTRDVNGNLRDTEQIAEDLGKRFAAMPFYMAKVRAAMMGIDERTLLALENPQVGAETGKYRSFAALFGLGPDWADQSNQFFTKLRDIQAEFEIIIIALANRLLPIAQGVVDFLSRFTLAAVDFKRTELGRALMELVTAAGALGMALLHLAEAIWKIIGPAVEWLAKFAFKELIAALHTVTDLIHVLTDLLHGDASKAWKDFGRAILDAMAPVTRTLAHMLDFIDQLNPFLSASEKASRHKAMQDFLNNDPALKPDAAPPAAQGPSLGDPGPAGGILGPSRGQTTPGITWKQKIAAGVTAYLQAHGLSAASAQGAGAGVFAEGGGLGFSANGAFGIGQWRGDRLRRLFATYGRNPTLDQQMAFLLSELRGGDPGGASVIGASSAAAALWAYASRFMRPDLPGEGHRHAMEDFNRGRGLIGAGSASSLNVQQKVDIHITSTGGAQETGHSVERAVNRTNSNLIRNLKTQVA